MAGSPLKRERKAGIRADDASVIAFRYMPRVADLPRGWRHWSPAEKIEHLLGMSLDRCCEILSWSRVSELDPHGMSMLAQVLRVILMICVKTGLLARSMHEGWRV
jgi:hypothetical protein